MIISDNTVYQIIKKTKIHFAQIPLLDKVSKVTFKYSHK